MPTYKYIARTKEGKPEEGFLEAISEDELVGVLQSRELTVVSFKEAQKTQSAKTDKHGKKRKMHKAATLDDLIGFSKQLTVLLNAGITLLRALEIGSLQIQSTMLYKAVEGIKKDVSTGTSLKNAVAKYPKVFSNLWVNIIETGETTGQLPFALDQLTAYLKSAASIKSKVQSALVYPSIILSVAGIAIIIFIVKIIPMFAELYKGFGAKLPGFTQMVFGFCLNVKKYILLFIIAGVAGVAGLKYYGNTYKGKRRLDAIQLKIPLIGELLREVSTVRFASGLSMLIKSGTPILHALDIVIETAGNSVVMEMLQNVKQGVREGRSMSEPLLQGGFFPDMVAHMISVGEESGELAHMLENAAQFYKEKVDSTVTVLTTMFEPFLIIFVGLIVSVLVIAMFLPIFGLSSAMGGGGG